jgi:hypothetical protein
MAENNSSKFAERLTEKFAEQVKQKLAASPEIADADVSSVELVDSQLDTVSGGAHVSVHGSVNV